MKTDGFIPAEWVMFQLSGMSANQEAAKGFIRESGVNPDQSWFAPIELKRLISNASFTTKDDHYGHSQEGMPLGSTSVAFRLMHTGVDGMEAINLLQRMSSLFTPNHIVNCSYDDEDVIISLNILGRDQEHSGAAELSHVFMIYASLNAFFGKIIPLKVLYSKSKIYTSLVEYNFETKCPVEYADFSGIRFPRSYLNLRRRAVIDRQPMHDVVRWSLLTTAIRSVSDSSPVPLMDAEQITAKIVTKAKSRNVDIRQKRRMFKLDTQSTERDLHKGVQLAQAMVLLVTTDLSIDDIATELGFSDERSFRRFFAGVTGQTPLRYRSTQQEPLDAIQQDHFGTILKSVIRLE
jgi:AraC-like DNA-binding protein